LKKLTIVSSGAVAPGVTGAVAPGAHYDPKKRGVTFAIYSAHAEKIELCLFDPKTQIEIARLTLPECTDGMWHGFVPGAKAGLAYGYRVHGPYDLAQGHRFNPHKLLLDPYATEMTGAFRADESHFAYDRHDPSKISRTDNAAFMVKGVVAAPSAFDWQGTQKPRTPWPKTVIYEAHIKGFSQLNEKLTPALRGTYAGLGAADSIRHFKNLGVTAVEIMPAQAFITEDRLHKMGLTNYWGYNTLNFFTPHSAYLSGQQRDEFKTMVRNLHAAGIEVIMDVVYNHTAEGDELGPTLSFRGIDNATYYALDPHNKAAYLNNTGCGNTVNANAPPVTKMIIDSLRHWVEEYQVDGFRFDLSVSLGRDMAQGFDYNRDAPLLRAIENDPVLKGVKLSGEPWDIGQNSYQLGRLPEKFYEWSDVYKKGVRDYWLNNGRTTELASRLAGSADRFNHDGKVMGRGIHPDTALRPRANRSIIELSTHDGFTLHDVFAYDGKQNHANGEQNRDGSNEASRNVGDQNRLRFLFNMIATATLSHGPLLLRMGDEMQQSQGGNNNAYCQDGPLSWLRWKNLDDKDTRTLQRFWQFMLDLRKGITLLNRHQFPHGQKQDVNGVKDLSWLSPHGQGRTAQDWADQNPCFGMMLNNAAFAAQTKAKLSPINENSRLLAVFNAGAQWVPFTLPAQKGEGDWVCLVNTSFSRPFALGIEFGNFADSSVYNIPPNSTVIFAQDAIKRNGPRRAVP